MAAALRGQTSQHPSQQRQKHKQDVALANYMSQQDVWAYQQSQMPADWSLYQLQQQQHQQHYAQTNVPCYFVPAYYHHAPYQQQMLYAPPPFSQPYAPVPIPLPPSHLSQHLQQQRSTRAYTSNASAATAWGAPSLQDPSSASSPTLSRPRDHAHRSSALLRQQQDDLMRRRSTQRPSLIHHGSNRPPSSSSSTTSSAGASSDLSSSDRRSSITSVSSTLSELSIGSKSSFSNRLRRVFGKSKSTQDLRDNGSIVSSISHKSIASSESSRRRSIGPFSSLFQKTESVANNATVAEETIIDEADYRHHSTAATATTKTTRPPSSKETSDVLGCHGSPKMRPVPSSPSLTESLGGVSQTRTRIQFCPTIQVHETFPADEYDRSCDSHATCQKLSPRLAMKIKDELNKYKLHEMHVHLNSRQYTHFFM